MLDRLAERLYARLGRRYKFVFVVTQIPASVGVALTFVALLISYYHPSAGELAVMAAATSFFTAVGVGYSLMKQRHQLVDLADWRFKRDPTPEETIVAWDAAVNFPMRSYKRSSLQTNAIAAVPSVAVIMAVLDLPLVAAPVILGSGIVAAAYGTVLTYSIAEFLLRPAVAEIAASLPDGPYFNRNGLPLRKRLLITLPVYTASAGMIVAALVTDHGGTRMMAISLAVAVGVGLALSQELTVLLGRSITRPIVTLRQALAQITAGDYEARVPVMSSDDLGELSHAFNQMARGLAEREQIREAFGTYLDKDVAGFILSGQFPDDGVEVEVTMMFCDVPAFTPFAESVSPKEVVAALNALFEQLVPIITRHGGHVDKFMGDGVLAVFGAPEGYADHADRALAAGLEILATINDAPEGLSVGVGLNTGRVVAGSIGGAGRLNFSVIGDAVNVAARVESATRDVDDDLLLTCATRAALINEPPVALVSRGSMALKGKSEPVELLAPLRERPADISAARGGATPAAR